MSYKVVIHTDKYRDKKCSKNNWEPGTMNDFMKAIDKWSIRERNLIELRWRINYIADKIPSDVYGDMWPKYTEWIDRYKSKNYIKFYDTLCEIERTEKVQVYGFAQGYFNIDKVIEEVRKNGTSKIPFSWFYDIRQYSKNMDGCYIEITKC